MADKRAKSTKKKAALLQLNPDIVWDKSNAELELFKDDVDGEADDLWVKYMQEQNPQLVDFNKIHEV